MASPIDETSDAAGTADDVDTSADLEDSDISWDDGDDVESDVDQSDDEAATDSDDDATEADDSDVNEDVEESTDDATDSDQQPQEDRTDSAKEDEERRRYNDEQARKRIADREARRQKQADDQQKYLQEADDATDQALRQLQVDAYNNRVMMLTNQIQADLNATVSTPEISQLINSTNPDVRESMLKALDDFEAFHIKKDEYGNITAVDGDVRQYLHAKADEIRRLTGVGKQEQAKAKETQKKRTTPTPTRAPKQAKNDDMGFEDYLTQYQ